MILFFTSVLFSCKNEDQRETSTIFYKVYGSGNIDFITYAIDCYPEGFLGCAVEEVAEKQELPFEIQINDVFTDIIFLRLYVNKEFERDKVEGIEIIINGERNCLDKENFWWLDGDDLMVLEYSVYN